jgi:hypothetical protein
MDLVIVLIVAVIAWRVIARIRTAQQPGKTDISAD